MCHKDKLLPVPSSLPLHLAATLMVNPATAYRMINDFVDLKEGIVCYKLSISLFLPLPQSLYQYLCVCVCVCVCLRVCLSVCLYLCVCGDKSLKGQ